MGQSQSLTSSSATGASATSGSSSSENLQQDPDPVTGNRPRSSLLVAPPPLTRRSSSSSRSLSSLFVTRKKNNSNQRQQQPQRRRRTKRDKESSLISSLHTNSTTTTTTTIDNNRSTNSIGLLSSIFKTNKKNRIIMESNRNNNIPTRTFHLFPKLTDDLKLCIISFVADAPFELFGCNNEDRHYNHPNSNSNSSAVDRNRRNTRNNVYDITKIGTWYSSLTHTLPFVNKQFHKLCLNYGDGYWKAALYRMVQTKESSLWQSTIHEIYPSLVFQPYEIVQQQEQVSTTETILNKNNSSNSNVLEDTNLDSSFNSRNGNQHDSNIDWIDQLSALLLATDVNNDDDQPHNFQQLYKYILNRQLRHVGPVFCMPANVKMNQAYGLHLFEPRYRLLIADVLRDIPREYKDGSKNLIDDGQYNVQFIHANNTPIEANETLGTLVQVIRCQIYNDGRADVLLLPIQHIWLEHLWIRQNSGNLVYGQARKLGMNEFNAIKKSS